MHQAKEAEEVGFLPYELIDVILPRKAAKEFLGVRTANQHR